MKHKCNHYLLGALLVVAGIFVGYFGTTLLENNRLNAEQKVAVEDMLIKAQVQQAHSMLQSVYDGYKDGLYSLNTAKRYGASILRDMRYGDDQQGYFWADTKEGVNVVLYGKKEVEGVNRFESNVNGIYFIKEIIKNGSQPGGGYTDFFYPKMNQSEPLAKRGFSMLFEPFGWVIGTGYYLEDVK